MKQQAGHISTQPRQAIGGSAMFLNYAIWDSVGRFRAAFNHPVFKSTLEHFPSSAVASPPVFIRLTVPNLCVAQQTLGGRRTAWNESRVPKQVAAQLLAPETRGDQVADLLIHVQRTGTPPMRPDRLGELRAQRHHLRAVAQVKR